MLICPKCSRVNPPEALFCHFDGNTLTTSAAVRPAVPLATRLFGEPLVFPSGPLCHTFTELVQACYADSAAALELLRQGRLAAFLQGLGREDLARAARDAAQCGDPERGLDDFLGQLPGNLLEPARLEVLPRSLDLGVLPLGEERSLELTLQNNGMRLVYGSAWTEAPWLLLGEGRGARQKVIQFRRHLPLRVRVRGAELQAYPTPRAAKIVFDTNGGRVAVTIAVLVPVQPFREGSLAGIVSPRQFVEKAKQDPRQAARLVESGAIERWYQANGWTYPVRGLRAEGIGALQQLLEALGVVRAPRVEIARQCLDLQGLPGGKVEESLTLSTREKRPVVAFATADQTWLRVGPTRFQKTTAIIPLSVPVVPHEPGATLNCKVIVTANGNQRFEVPVSLTISAGLPAAIVCEIVETSELVPVAPVYLPNAFASAPDEQECAVPLAPLLARKTPVWVHLVPLLLLILGLLAAAGRDYWRRWSVSKPERGPMQPTAPLSSQRQTWRSAATGSGHHLPPRL